MPKATKRLTITFKPNGEGTVKAEGLGSFACLGQPGREYPKDMTVDESDKSESHWSKEFNTWMYWCILIWGQKGIYIHEGPNNLEENTGPSKGCIHLGKGDAKTVYDWVDGTTRVLISYPW